MNSLRKIAAFAVGIAWLSISAFAQIVPPQGRLTLGTGPVMLADATGLASVYYTPYVGNQVPIYNGTSWASYVFGNTISSSSVALVSTSQTSGNIYDVFIWFATPNILIGVGPAWSSSTSRGSGAGTTQLTQLDGLWVNANSITLINGTNTYSSIPADEATYLGSVYMTANGAASMQLNPSATSGGTANVMGLYNAYNRLKTTAYCRDNTSNWTYGTASWRAADNSTSNKIYFLDGLQQSPVTSNYSVLALTTLDTVGAFIGLNIDSSTTTPDIASETASAASESSASQSKATETFYPVLGLHYIQAVEYATGTNAQFFGINNQQVMALTVSLDM